MGAQEAEWNDFGSVCRGERTYELVKHSRSVCDVCRRPLCVVDSSGVVVVPAESKEMLTTGCWRRVVVLAAQDFFAVAQGCVVKGDPGSAAVARAGPGSLGESVRHPEKYLKSIRIELKFGLSICKIVKAVVLKKRSAAVQRRS